MQSSPFQDREFLQLRRRILEGYGERLTEEAELLVQQG